MSNDKLLQLLEERRKKQAAERPTEPDTREFEASIPRREDVSGELSEAVQAINDAVETITIFQIYDRLIGKQRDRVGNKTESIMASCPNPGHPDKRPSAWFGQRDGKWLLFCGKCEEGWDMFKLAGLAYGLDDQTDLWKIKLELAENFRGVRLVEGLVGTEVQQDVVSEPETDTPDNSDKGAVTDSPGRADQPEQAAAVLSIVPETEETDDEETSLIYPTIDWKHLVTEDTFLWEYMTQCTIDDAPEEYHFWHGLIAVGHALGRRTVLVNVGQPVFGNLFVCMLGGTGFGKSKSRRYLKNVVENALPFKDNGLDTEGVRVCGTVVSGEALLDAFSHEARDPSLNGGKPTGVHTSVNGIADYDELSTVIELAKRQGNILKPVMMKFYDAETERQRSRKYNEIVAKDPYCSITSSTQPRAVKKVLSNYDAASGFLNRWLFAGGPRKEVQIFSDMWGEVDLTDAIDLLKNLRAWSLSPGNDKIEWTDEARLALTKFYTELVFPAMQRDETDLLKRLDLLFKKIILLFAANENQQKVTEDIVERVETLFQYVIECYGIIDSQIGITPIQEMEQDILRIIEKQKARFDNGMTPADIKRYTNRKYSAEDINRGVKTLTHGGYLSASTTQAGKVGRKTTRYSIA